MLITDAVIYTTEVRCFGPLLTQQFIIQTPAQKATTTSRDMGLFQGNGYKSHDDEIDAEGEIHRPTVWGKTEIIECNGEKAIEVFTSWLPSSRNSSFNTSMLSDEDQSKSSQESAKNQKHRHCRIGRCLKVGIVCFVITAIFATGLALGMVVKSSDKTHQSNSDLLANPPPAKNSHDRLPQLPEPAILNSTHGPVSQSHQLHRDEPSPTPMGSNTNVPTVRKNATNIPCTLKPTQANSYVPTSRKNTTSLPGTVEPTEANSNFANTREPTSSTVIPYLSTALPAPLPTQLPCEATQSPSEVTQDTSEPTSNTASPVIDQFSITSSPTDPFTDHPTFFPTFPPSNHQTNYPTFLPTVSRGQQEQITTAPTIPMQQGQYNNASSSVLVGAYYYPWYGNDFHHHGGYLRKFLSPRQSPSLGEYDDSLPSTVAQHLAWSRQANIGLWVTSWWGPNRLEDSNTKNVILKHKDLGDMKIALHYESTHRILQNSNGQYSIENAASDLIYMCDNYFDHPNYLKIQNRPVVFLYVARVLMEKGILDQVVSDMRKSAMNACGMDIYVSGDITFGPAPAPGVVFDPFLQFDAVTNYDMYGSMMSGSSDVYAGTNRVDKYFQEQADWQARALEHGTRFIPGVSPGFNDRGVRLQANHKALSRQLTSASVEGSLFEYAIPKAMALVDDQVQNLFMVNSWNEWHEDSQIEPCVGVATSIPDTYTNGVVYLGYGELFLDLLRNATK